MSVGSAALHAMNAVAAAVNAVNAVAAAMNAVNAVAAAMNAVAAAVTALSLHAEESVASADVVSASVCETLGNGVTLRLGCR